MRFCPLGSRDTVSHWHNSLCLHITFFCEDSFDLERLISRLLFKIEVWFFFCVMFSLIKELLLNDYFVHRSVGKATKGIIKYILGMRLLNIACFRNNNKLLIVYNYLNNHWDILKWSVSWSDMLNFHWKLGVCAWWLLVSVGVCVTNWSWFNFNICQVDMFYASMRYTTILNRDKGGGQHKSHTSGDC